MWTLPERLRIALCDGLGVSRTDRNALEVAWAELLATPPERQRIVTQGTVVQIRLEGEPEQGPLIP